MSIHTRPAEVRAGYARYMARPDTSLRIRIRPGTLANVYAVRSRDVSQGAPVAPRVETRPANETDFTPDGVAEPDTEVPMPQWHKGVTN